MIVASWLCPARMDFPFSSDFLLKKSEPLLCVELRASYLFPVEKVGGSSIFLENLASAFTVRSLYDTLDNTSLVFDVFRWS